MSPSSLLGDDDRKMSSQGITPASFSSFDTTKNTPLVSPRSGGHSLSYDMSILAVPYMLLEAGLAEGLMRAGMDGNTASNTAQVATLLYGFKSPQKINGNLGVSNNSSEVTEQLLKVAGSLEKNGLTAAGRALQKHGDRVGSIFPRATGNAESINAQANSILTNILNHPNRIFQARHHGRFGDIIEYTIPGGHGVRFGENGQKFIGFIEKQ